MSRMVSSAASPLVKETNASEPHSGWRAALGRAARNQDPIEEKAKKVGASKIFLKQPIEDLQSIAALPPPGRIQSEATSTDAGDLATAAPLSRHTADASPTQPL